MAAAFLLSLGLTGCGPAAEESSPPKRASKKGDPQAAFVARFEGRSFEDVRNEAFRMQEAQEESGLVLEALKAAHALDPGAYGVNRRLGQVYGELKLSAQALEHFHLARAAKPESLENGLSIVRLLLALGRQEEALEELGPLLAGADTRDEALFHKARILDFLGDRDGALQTVQLADSLGAYHAISLHGRFLMQQGDYVAAEALFTKALRGRADYKEALRGMADACRRLGRAEEADKWDRILKLFLDLTDNVFIRKNPTARKRYLEQLVAEYPIWTGGFQQWALLLRREGDKAGACRVVSDFLDSHADLVDPSEAAALRHRFCSGVPR